MADRENYVYEAKLAEQAERYDEMVRAMKHVSQLQTEMTVEERNLLSVGYKNVIGSRRASWRIISNIEQKERSKESDNQFRLGVIIDYRKDIEKELEDICKDVLDLLGDYLIPAAMDIENKIFFNKMKGDYNRYMAEFSVGDVRAQAAKNSLLAYKDALDIANGPDGLIATHPIKLGLSLNFSVFYYEILSEPAKAVVIAKNAFDQAVSMVETLPDDFYKDSTLIMQLLRDNLTLWTSEDEKGGATVDGQE